jgi:hypothetical protein
LGEIIIKTTHLYLERSEASPSEHHPIRRASSPRTKFPPSNLPGFQFESGKNITTHQSAIFHHPPHSAPLVPRPRAESRKEGHLIGPGCCSPLT